MREDFAPMVARKVIDNQNIFEQVSGAERQGIAAKMNMKSSLKIVLARPSLFRDERIDSDIRHMCTKKGC